MGYMGVQIVGTAQVIDTWVQNAWGTFLAAAALPTTPQAFALQNLYTMVQWDDTTKIMSTTKDLYNVVSQFVQFLTVSKGITKNWDGEVLDEVTYEGDGSYYGYNAYDLLELGVEYASGYVYNSFKANANCRIVAIGYTVNTQYTDIYFVYDDTFKRKVEGNRSAYPEIADNNLSNVSNYVTYNNHNYYIASTQWRIIDNAFINNSIPQYMHRGVSSADAKTLAVRYTYGDLATGAELEDNIYVNGTSELDDRVMSTDNGVQVVLDPAVPAGATLTLEEVLSNVLDWALTDTWPDDIAITDAFPIALPEPIDTVIVPTAPDVPVPQPILPQNLPIIFSPECESFSACLVAGVTEVSTELNIFYNANDSIRNFANIVLYLGLSFVALGVIRRHL